MGVNINDNYSYWKKRRDYLTAFGVSVIPCALVLQMQTQFTFFLSLNRGTMRGAGDGRTVIKSPVDFL
jgi:hypothetical protein